MTKSRIKKSRKRAMFRGVIAAGRTSEQYARQLLKQLGFEITIEDRRTT